MSTLEGMEQRLDAMAAEALRRAARRLDIAGADKIERAAGMAAARAEIRRWRDRATGAALRAAVATRRPGT